MLYRRNWLSSRTEEHTESPGHVELANRFLVSLVFPVGTTHREECIMSHTKTKSLFIRHNLIDLLNYTKGQEES